MLKSLKSFETLNLARPSKKALLSPQATTHIDYHEIIDLLVEEIKNNEEDLTDSMVHEMQMHRDLIIEIMKESLDAELAYDYINCAIGRGIIIGIIVTLLGNKLAYEAYEDESDGQEEI